MATPKVTVRPVRVRGKMMHRVRFLDQGKVRRLFFSTRSAADAEAARLRGEIASVGQAWLALPAPEREALMQAYSAAKKNGVDLGAALRRVEEQPLAQAPKLSAVVAELVAAKENAGRIPRYTKNLKIVLKQFSAGLESLAIDKISLAQIELFLASKKIAYRSTLRARLSTLFNFAIRRGYRLDNPCARLEVITVTKIPPQIFSPAEFSTAVKWLRVHAPHGLAWFALSTVCGLRPEEGEKTDEKRDLNFKEKFIRIEAQTTKVRQRRIVYPKREAMRFLKWALKAGGKVPLHPLARKRILHRLRGELGFKVWPKDVTRHTAASYWLAADGSAAHVAEMLGNSENVLKRDYKALVTKVVAREFWKMVGKF